ncbi:MAG: SagB/ThcOx family dehydrogenase [Candidatus Izimaplasma sp.]|nr:SagB/ThcOx family dehydrogenase [Candidatus Izimaplasma bacterium]
MLKKKIKTNRNAIKPMWTDLYNIKTAKSQKLEKPKAFIEPDSQNKIIKLVKKFSGIKQKTLTECIASRRSLRSYSEKAMSFEELSYLLWETSRVDHMKDDRAYKTIPTAGATNSGETYIYANNVEEVDNGVYLYVQNKHELALINQTENISNDINQAILRQLRDASVVFFFTAVAPRVEYKYDFVGPKLIAIEAGHSCQNLSLAAEVIDAGACAIAAYNQEKVDDLLKIDGEDHFTVYCATVGKK